MSTGLFADEEDGYNLDETKYKLKLGNSNPTQNTNDFDNDMSSDTLDGLEDFDDVSSEDKPFDDTPFEAGVEADEESNPKTFIQQLAGKLGQSLRAYSEEQGQPDFELDKFVVNSVLSATHTGQMDNEDQKDIIKKVKSSGNNSNDIDVNVDVDTDADDVNVNAEKNDNHDDSDDNMNFGDEDVEENIILGENLENSNKNTNFVIKVKDMNKLFENTEVSPVTKPDTKPTTTPDTKPSRRQRPWRPIIQPKTTPKANNGVLSETSGSSGKIINTKFLDDSIAILTVNINDKDVDMKFENTNECIDKPKNIEQPWIYKYKSINSVDDKEYTVGVKFFGESPDNLKLDSISDDYIQEN